MMEQAMADRTDFEVWEFLELKRNLRQNLLLALSAAQP